MASGIRETVSIFVCLSFGHLAVVLEYLVTSLTPQLSSTKEDFLT